MGAINLSSSPLSTLYPSYSPQVDPDYSNIFKIDFNNLNLASFKPQLTNYAQKYASDMLPYMNSTKFNTGLTLSTSSNALTAMTGKQMMGTTKTGTSIDWSKGFDLLSSADQSSKTGKITAGLGKVGSSAVHLSKMSKAAGGFKNLTGAQKAGGVGAIIGATSDLIGGFMPEKDEYSGEKGHITQTLDTVYDSISDAAMSMGPWGCVCAGSRVINNEGKFINIEELTQEEGIIGWGNREVHKENIYALKDPGYKDCLRIELQSGTFLECSTDHPILYAPKGRADRITINGKRVRVKQWQFKPAEKLEIGDNVGIVNEIPIWGNSQMWNPYLVGMLIGDGTYGKDHGVRLFSADSDTWKYIEENNLGVQIKVDNDGYSKEFRAYRIHDGAKHLRDLGIYEQTKENKRLPKNIHIYDKESVCKLIAGLIDTDGCVYINEEKKDYKVIFYQKNKSLIDQLREQLLKLGIHSSIQLSKERTSVIKDRLIHSNPIYKLVIKDSLSLISFYNNIHLNIKYKQEHLDEIYRYCTSVHTKDNRLISGAKADKVVSITPIGSKLVYNLQADDDHTYIANGIITHNTLVGGIMKGGAMLGKGLNALGGGTDGKTTTDAILGSSFLNLTPFGLINGFGGKKTDTITKNNEVFSQVGTSYTGTESTVDQAIAKQGKYGAFSSGARKRANRLIAEAKRQQGIIEDIADLAQDRFAIRDSMAAINGNRLRFQLQGGYNQANVRVGKLGMSLNKARETLNRINYKREPTEILSQDIQKMKEGGQIKAVSTEIFLIIPEFQKGGTIEDPFEHYVSTLPLAQRDSTDYRVRDYWEYNGRPKDFEEAKKKGMFSFNQKDNSYHARSVAENLQTGDIEFMKSSNHPTIFMETDWYEKGLIHNDDGTTLQLEPGIEGYEDWQDFKNNYELQKTDPYWKYVRRKDTLSHKEGGQIQPTKIILVESGIDAFKEGGSINVIPEGALHARKHNMDMEGITKKGIPVVSDKENGEIEQQAEIERSEIIYRKSVTEELERLCKIYYDDNTSQKEKDRAAIEAGKLLVEETLHNTIDNTGELL